MPILLLLLTLISPIPALAQLATGPRVILPPSTLQPDQLGLIVNTMDPISIKIGQYYAQVRKIPSENIVQVSFPPARPNLDPTLFATAKATVDAALPARVQALALTWAAPYRVGCMSVTTAFAAGYDADYCAQGCNTTKLSPLFNSASLTPYDDFGVRPCMALAATDFASGKALIDRGAESDQSWPDTATAYLLDTSDKARNVRRRFYAHILTELGQTLPIKRFYADSLIGRKDILFYFTGVSNVDGMETNTFLPGAVADHLTSTGGQLTDSTQMSALRWIQAGATGSYGTVLEPCNFVEKFPNPYILISRYLNGESLVLAYWKSVAMPGQGIFIGDPLACPFGGHTIRIMDDAIELTTHTLRPGLYSILASNSGKPPYRLITSHIVVRPGKAIIVIPERENIFYHLVPEK